MPLVPLRADSNEEVLLAERVPALYALCHFGLRLFLDPAGPGPGQNRPRDHNFPHNGKPNFSHQ